jgi:pimeloyl-ACP methyl ester carboxylesterase
VTAREVVVDGIRIHLVEAGAGPALVLLHGLSATHANWEHTISAFADRWRVVALDLPGHGRSGKPDAPYTIDFYAGIVRTLGHELGIREAVVVGNSLGGQIAVELGLTYPAWTRGLVLVAPAGGFPGAVRAFGWAIGAAANPRVLRVTLPRALDLCFWDASSPGCAERQRMLAERLAGDDYPQFARAVARSLAGAIAAGRQPLHRLTQPTLLVWGREDRVVGLAGSRRILREVRHARLAVLERCGHLPMLERPQEFNRLLAEFLRAVEAHPLPAARSASGGT